MKIILDACSIINLVNSDGLEACANLERCKLFLGPIVFGECSEGPAQKLIELINTRKIIQLTDADIPTNEFLGLLAHHNLGEGETECIAAATSFDFIVCSDDGHARKIAIEQLGRTQVVGSARLLRWCVEEKLLICKDANQQFEMMKKFGGFLPKIPDDFFCSTKT